MELVWALIAFAVVFLVVKAFRSQLSAATDKGRFGMAKAWVYENKWRSLVVVSLFWGGWMTVSMQ